MGLGGLKFISRFLVAIWLFAINGVHAQVRINEICAVSSDRLIRWDTDGLARIGAGQNWFDTDFDSTAWENGEGPVGMGPSAVTDLQLQMKGTTPSVYLRKTFVVSDEFLHTQEELLLEVEYTDGFVAYLNGIEIGRGNAGASGAPLMHDQVAYNGAVRFIEGFQNAVWTNSYSSLSASDYLQSGTNVLAIQAHNNDTYLFDTTLMCKATLQTASGDETLADSNGIWDWFVGIHEPSGGVVDYSVDNGGNVVLPWTWTLGSFEDGGWTRGLGGIGFGDGDDATDVQSLMQGTASTLYMRSRFNVTNPSGSLQFTVDYDDGFVAYLNGEEIARRNAGIVGNFVPFTSTATVNHEAGVAEVITLGAAEDFVTAGTNLLAIQVLNRSLTSSDLTMNVQLDTFEGSMFVSEGDTWRYFIGTDEPAPVVDAEPEDDEDSGFLDWIELKNEGMQPVSLEGWSLSDDVRDPNKWVFPDVTIPAGEYLVVACSLKNVRDPDATMLHTGFALKQSGEYLGLSNDNGAFVSELKPGFPEQHPFYSYGWDEASASFQYHTFPTPGKMNCGATFSILPEPPIIAMESGFYEGSLNVEIISPDGGAVYYTTDGSAPTQRYGRRYQGPLTVTSNTTLRAAVVNSGSIVSEPVTRTFLLNVPDALKSLPAVVLTGDEGRSLFRPHGVSSIVGGSRNGIYWQPDTLTDYNIPIMRGRPYERRVCFEMFKAGTNLWSQVDCGVRIVASAWSRSKLIFDNLSGVWYAHPHTDKAQFNIFCRGIYGDDAFKNRLLPESPLKDIVQFRIRSGKNDWNNPFIRDEFMRRLYSDMGQVSSVGTLAGLWVNGTFRCYYNPVERYGEPFYQARYNSDLEWDTLSHDPVGIDKTSVNEGDRIAWNEMHAFIGANEISILSNYHALAQLVDVENYADYMLVNIYGGSSDWGNNNWHASRERSINGRFRFHVWDAESALNKGIDYNVITARLQANSPLGRLYRALAASSEFKVLMQDRIAEHFFNGGCMETNALQIRYDDLADTLDPMIQYVRGEPVNRAKVNTWIAERNPYFFQQMRDNGFWSDLTRPTISPAGGYFTGAQTISLGTMNDGGQLFYTLDGTDPRLPGGAVGGIPYGGPFEINRSAQVKARIFKSGIWGPLAETVFYQDHSDLLLTEVHYQPAGVNSDQYEFVEFQNAGNQPLNLNGYAIDGGIEFSFDAGVLWPGEHVVVVRDLNAFAERYTTNGMFVVGEYSGKLSNSGDKLRLEFYGEKLFEVVYKAGRGWPLAANGGGHSLVPLTTAILSQGFDILDYPEFWRSSTYIGGSPGLTEPEPPNGLMINEILADTDTGDPAPFDSNDQVELYNPTGSSVELDGEWYLSDDLKNLYQWNMPEGTTIPPGGWIVFDENDFHADRSTGFGLNNAGEMLALTHRGSGMERIVDSVAFEAQANGTSWGRYPDADPFFQTLEPSPGLSNRLRPDFGIRIAELMYHPQPVEGHQMDSTLEYIRLTNGSPLRIEFVGESVTNTWRISGGVNYSFGDGIALDAGEMIWIVPFEPSVDILKKLLFCSTYRLDAESVRLVGPWQGELSNRGERITLERAKASGDDLRPDDVSWIIIDEVTWLDEEPWSDAADGMGSPLMRIGSAGNDPDSWRVPFDFDGDGIPDQWERSIQPGLNYFGFGDFDGDGQSDWTEYIAGTVPVDAQSYFKYNGSEATDGGYLLNWDSVSGRNYTISWSSNLSLPFFPVVAELKYPKSSYTDLVYHAESAGFYRIGVWTNAVPAE